LPKRGFQKEGKYPRVDEFCNKEDASLSASDSVYILHEGRIKAHGSGEEMEKSREIREAYLGI